MGAIIIEALSVGPFQSNVFIVRDADSNDAVIIDPGDEVPRILKILKKHDLKLKYILLTHGHIDHVGGAKDLKDATGAHIMIHKEDLFLYEKVQLQASLFGMQSPEIADPDMLLEDRMEIGEGALRCRVIHTPGHTPGSVSFYFDGMVFTGDALFRDGIGRTDLWGGSYEMLMDSILNRLMKLDDTTEVYPGHGPQTSIGREKIANPFLQETHNWDTR